MSTSESCAGCGAEVGPDDSLSLGQRLTFHHGCLVCAGCGLELEGRTVSLDREDRPHCSPCYERSASNLHSAYLCSHTYKSVKTTS